MSAEDQLKAIPKEFYEKIVLTDQIITRSKPGVTLTKHHRDHGGSWNCDRIRGVGRCLSGLTGFHQSRGIEGWNNRSHDFDMCIKCAQADRFIEMVLNKEDDLIR